MQQPREERRMKREKKRYFLTKMIKKSPEGTPILFTFHFSLFTQGVLQIFATPPEKVPQALFLTDVGDRRRRRSTKPVYSEDSLRTGKCLR
jgi:hypothetical protein